MYVTLAENIVPLEYTTDHILTPGTVYSFKVTARNLVGHSLMSDSIEILAAQPPDVIVNLADVPF